MKTTKETIRQSFSIKLASVIYSIYGDNITEWKKALTYLNKVAKNSKRNEIEFDLGEVILNYTR